MSKQTQQSQNLRVFKFGGSSVGRPERIQRVTDLITSEIEHGPLAVTVSAMGDTTDWLIEAMALAAGGHYEEAVAVADRIQDLATTNALVTLQLLEQAGTCPAPRPALTATVRTTLEPLRQLLYGVSLLRECSPQTADLILSFGERTSAQVLAALLTFRGVPATYLDGRRWTVTDDTFGEALVDFEPSKARLREIQPEWDGAIPVCTGFLGKTPDDRTTTLGRNGSDYTASLLARALDAKEVNIWTDVSGVMTADPGLVRDAYPLSKLSYMEAVELAWFGTRMFHPRTMIPLIESGIPMRIRNTMAPQDPGTVINATGHTDTNEPTSVTSLEDMALLDVEWRRLSTRAQVGERVLEALERADIPVWMATQSAHGQSVAAVIRNEAVDAARAAIMEELAKEYQRKEVNPIGLVPNVTLLTLVCGTMGKRPNVAGRFFSALGAVGVNIRAIAQGASLRSISCVIDGDDTARAVSTVHTAFNFAHQEVSVLLLGKGVVGGHLLQQIQGQAEALLKNNRILLRVVGIADSGRYLYDENGLDLDGWKDALPDGVAHGGDLSELLARLARLPVPLLIDCTAADGMEALYHKAFAHGIHVAAANKKPLTIPWEQRQALMADADAHYADYAYETTVGASLPVIDTLKNLVRTGDRVRLIEGCLSGTLGYLTNEVMDGVALSEAVANAKSLGYTEPRPQEDLSGIDVARKALILARELGLELELSDVVVEPLVPESLMPEDEDVATFFERLAGYDAEFSARIDGLKAEGKSLRYLARINPEAGPGEPKLTVGPIGLPNGHPATQLRGSESFVAFSTERYQDYPLIVRGAGAGGAVTAAGVLADALKISQTLRGR
ncbi:MAG: aspartokinase/homoserine dehydrogenase 1 [Myxococcota bacterium]|jgi:aspartokinase/homoserine dehydrogenase 1